MLTFVTEPLGADLCIAGSAVQTVQLTSTVDTIDLTATVVDQHPPGRPLP